MHAWILSEPHGTYAWTEVETPEPGPTDVRVRPVASALNHMDLWVTKGLPQPTLPHVPGCDVAGVIDAVGALVDDVAVGDEVVCNPAVSPSSVVLEYGIDSPLGPGLEVIGENRWGGHAEAMVVPARNVVPRPQGRTWEECAAFPLTTLTAWRMVRRARLTQADRVLVVGFGSGVSAAATSLALAAGAEVHVTSTSPDKRRRALEMGVAGAYASDDDGPVQVDVVFESVGPATWERSMRALRPGGRLVVCGGTSGREVTVNLPKLFYKQWEIIGATMGSYVEFAQVTDLVARGLPIVVDEIFPLDRYPEALERLANRGQIGKVVLRHPAPGGAGPAGGSTT
jgi:NADPH:quinone reductase-like Zn-dependent oxidoreductase